MSSNKYLIASIWCFLMMHAICQEIQFRPLPSISTPFIVDGDYSVTQTLVYPHADSPKLQKTIEVSLKAQVSTSQLSFYDKDQQIKTVPILQTKVQVANIHEYMAVTFIYPELIQILKINQQGLALPANMILRNGVDQALRKRGQLKSNDVTNRNHRQPGLQVQPGQSYQMKQSKQLDLMSVLVALVLVVLLSVFLFVKLKDSGQKKSSFNKLHRFGSSSIEREEDDEQESIIMNVRKNDYTIDSSFIDD